MTLYSRVVIIDPNGVARELGSENVGYSLSLDQELAHKAEIYIADPSSQYYSLYPLGSMVEIFCGATQPPTSKVFLGYLEDVELTHQGKNRKTLKLICSEYFHVKAANILVAERYVNKKAGEVVRHLVQNYLPEFNVSNVEDTDLTVEEIIFDYVSLLDALDELSKLAYAEYYSDPYKNLFFHQRGSKLASMTVYEDQIISSVLRESAAAIKNRVIVLGGFEKKVDAQQAAANSYIQLNENYYAASFTPTQRSLMGVELYLQKVGEPSDLIGRVVEDVSGYGPVGSKIAGFIIPSEQVSSGGWYQAVFDEQLRTEKKHWIVVDKNGDANNTYRWFHDAGSEGEYAYSNDGEQWTVAQNTFRFAFKTYFGEPVLEEAVNPDSIRMFGERCEVVVDRNISRKETAKHLALAKLRELSSVKRKLSFKAALQTLPTPNMPIYVNYPSIPLLSYFTVSRVDVEFEKGLNAVEEVTVEVVS